MRAVRLRQGGSSSSNSSSSSEGSLGLLNGCGMACSVMAVWDQTLRPRNAWVVLSAMGDVGGARGARARWSMG